MTTINCSSNCKHQQDGKCTLENAFSNALSTHTDCAFFEEKPAKKDSGFNCKSWGE
jgi:hypothetical protein